MHKASIRSRLREHLPPGARRTLGELYRSAAAVAYRSLGLPMVRRLRAMQLRRLRPLADGRPRGQPVVRYYWDHFLTLHENDIRGKCIEIGTTRTLLERGRERVTTADALDLSAHSPEITVVADLSRADDVPGDRYDCMVNQFTMHMIYDLDAALYHSVRMLAPGGILLVNFPCVEHYLPRGIDMGTGRPLFVYWGFTPLAVENLLRRAGLTESDYRVTVYGNAFARVAYEMNMTAEELSRTELDTLDPRHPLLICARIARPPSWKGVKPEYKDPWVPDVSPAVWTPETGHYAGK